MSLHHDNVTVSAWLVLVVAVLSLVNTTSRQPIQVLAQTTATASSSSSSSSSATTTTTTSDEYELLLEPETSTTKIAFGSCHKNHLASSPRTIWETISKTETVIQHRNQFVSARDDNVDDDDQSDDDNDENLITAVRPLDAWIWTGDAIYPPHRDPITHRKTYREATLQEMKESLDEMKFHNKSIGYVSFLQGTFEQNYWNATEKHIDSYNIPPPKHIYGVWDDHDWGGNDFGNRMPQQEERKQIFMDFLGYPRRSETDNDDHNDKEKEVVEILPSSRPGFYHSFEMTDDPFPSKYYSKSASIIDSMNRQREEGRTRGSRGGKIKVIILDTRSQREDHCIRSVGQSIPLGAVVACLTRWLTSGLLLYKYAGLWGYEGCERNKILDDDQWSWFEQELLGPSSQSLSETAETDVAAPDLYVIVSTIQVWSTNPATESWGQFPHQQERLWNLLRTYYDTTPSTTSSSSSSSQEEEEEQQRHRAPVVFLSGDVHHAEISGQPGWFDVTSSGLTHHCGQHKLYGWTSKAVLESFPKHRYHSKLNYFIGLNYGVLQVDWDRRIYEVLVKDSNGDEVLGISQSLDDPPPSMPPYKDLPHTWDGHLIPYVQKLTWCVIGGAVAIITFIKFF